MLKSQWNVSQRFKTFHDLNPDDPPSSELMSWLPSAAHLFQTNPGVDELVDDGLGEAGVSQEEGGEKFIILQNIIYLQAAALTEQKTKAKTKEKVQLCRPGHKDRIYILRIAHNVLLCSRWTADKTHVQMLLSSVFVLRLCLLKSDAGWAAKFLGGKFRSSSQLLKPHFKWTKRKTDIFSRKMGNSISLYTLFCTVMIKHLTGGQKERNFEKSGASKNNFLCSLNVKSLHSLVENAAFELSNDSIRVYKHYIPITVSF